MNVIDLRNMLLSKARIWTLLLSFSDRVYKTMSSVLLIFRSIRCDHVPDIMRVKVMIPIATITGGGGHATLNNLVEDMIPFKFRPVPLQYLVNSCIMYTCYNF